jgi:hypothetical protein
MLTGIAIYSQEQIIQALQNQLGHIGLAAAELNVPRGQLMKYLIDNPDIAEIKKQIKEATKDDAESLLVEGMKTDHTLLMFYLRTQCQDRGYGTSSSTTIKGDKDNPLQVNVNARTLIAAMRNGFEKDPDIDEEEPDEVSDLFQRSGLLPG